MKMVALKILQNNYIWLIIKNKNAIAIDCGEAEVLLQYLKEHSLNLKYILVTHHHSDHTIAIPKVKKLTQAKVIAGVKTLNLLPNLPSDHIVMPGQTLNLLDTKIKAIFTPGHSEDHMVYYLPEHHRLFSGDLIFTLGCGRAFFCMKALYNSLLNIKSLPLETRVCSGHNYGEANLKFAQYTKLPTITPKANFNEMLTSSFSCLKNELIYNPFLNANNIEFKRILNKEKLSDFEFFKYLRTQKDSFS